jgi:hypothetical protein
VLNIGGGNFKHKGWTNLDELRGFVLSPETRIEDGHDLIYSSHCLEHLDDETVERLLSESRRVCKTLVIKIPDFDKLLRKLEERDSEFFQHLGMNDLVKTWPRDSLEMRAAMMFCGYWDKTYGHEFLGPRNLNGYHGPPILSDEEYREIFRKSPHEISKTLVALAPKEITFNHRNAWSRGEFLSLLKSFGFSVVSTDPEEVCRMKIPQIRDYYQISLYVHAV